MMGQKKDYPHKPGMMRVVSQRHFGAALLTELESDEYKTMLVQDSGDMLEMLGDDWEPGIHYILDDYMNHFTKEDKR